MKRSPSRAPIILFSAFLCAVIGAIVGTNMMRDSDWDYNAGMPMSFISGLVVGTPLGAVAGAFIGYLACIILGRAR